MPTTLGFDEWCEHNSRLRLWMSIDWSSVPNLNTHKDTWWRSIPATMRQCTRSAIFCGRHRSGTGRPCRCNGDGHTTGTLSPQVSSFSATEGSPTTHGRCFQAIHPGQRSSPAKAVASNLIEIGGDGSINELWIRLEVSIASASIKQLGEAKRNGRVWMHVKTFVSLRLEMQDWTTHLNATTFAAELHAQ